MSNIHTSIHDVLEIKIRPIVNLGDYDGKPRYTQTVVFETEDGRCEFVAHFAEAIRAVDVMERDQ